jgi:hypothetical protein
MLRRCCLTVLIFLVFVSASPLPVQGTPAATAARPPLKLELRDHRGGEANAVFARGTYAYAGFSIEFAILDVADPGAPTRLGFVLMPGVVVDVVVVGQYAFVTCSSAGLLVVDIADPTSPTIIGNVALPGGASYVEVVGNYAYVTNGDLNIVDISNPREPRLVSRYEHGIGGIDIVDNILYLTDTFAGLLILDISDPQSIKLLSKYDVSPAPRDVAVDDKYAYVTTSSGLHIFDVSNVAVPIEVGKEEIFPAPSDIRVEIAGPHAYLMTEQGDLRIVDVSDATHPTQVSMLDLINSRGGIAGRFTLAGDYVYLVAPYAGVRIINVADVAAPVEVGLAAYAVPNFSWNMVVYNHYLYADEHIFDVRSQDQLNFVSTFNGRIRVIEDGYGYGQGLSANAGVGIWSLADPTKPTTLGNYYIRGPVGATSINYPYLYLQEDQHSCGRGGCQGGGLHIVDISNRTAPKRVAYFSNILASSLTAAGNFLYAVVLDKLHVYDASNPGTLVNVGVYPAAYRGHVVIHGQYAYLTLGTAGMRILDITNPAKLVERAVVPLPAGGVVVSESYAYVHSFGGVYVVDITDVVHPFVVASYILRDSMPWPWSYALAVDGEMLYFAADGLFALRLTEAQITDHLYLPSLLIGTR